MPSLSLTKAANYAVLLDDALRIYDGPVCEFMFKRARGILCLSFTCSCEVKRLSCNARKHEVIPIRMEAYATQQAIRKLRLADIIFASTLIVLLCHHELLSAYHRGA